MRAIIHTPSAAVYVNKNMSMYERKCQPFEEPMTKDNRSSRNSSTSVASSSMFSSPPKREIEQLYNLQNLQKLQLDGSVQSSTHGSTHGQERMTDPLVDQSFPTIPSIPSAHPQSIEEVDESESLSSSSRLESLASSPSPTKFAERGLSGKLDELLLNVEWSPQKENDQPITIQIGCKCHGLNVHRTELEEGQSEWKLRPVEVARDLVASFVELIQHSASSLEWSKAYLLHDIEWKDGFCWGGDASYNVDRDGPIVLTADTSTTCPRMTEQARDRSFEMMIRNIVRVIKRRDAAAVVTVGETGVRSDTSLHVVMHVNHFCTR